ncbi:VCBS repeat-containing protein, partial [bacterium]|nr:VCBS repeat-containing protein [bacterium]
GSSFSGWPQNTVPNLYWPFEAGVTDVNGDGKKEIYTTTPEKKFILWNKDGEVVNSFGLSDAAHSAPRAADINSDGQIEFIITQADGSVNVVDQTGKPLQGWPYKTSHSIYSAPQIVDLDGDGKLDIVYTAWNPEGVGKQAGYVMALDCLGKPLPSFPKYIGKSIAPVTIADLDGDGFLEIIASGGINYTDDQLHVFPTNGKIPIKIAVLGTQVSF